MAGVPEIEVPTAQPEAMPVVPVQGPPLGAVGGAHVGAGLEKIGEALFDEGYRSYHLAAEAQAQELETEFQARALKIRDEYRNKYNMDAISSHDPASKALEAARKEVGNSITSKHGMSLYMNNSLRNARFVQESMDAHFESQNRSYHAAAYKQGEEGDVRTVAALAGDGEYNTKNVEELIDSRREKAFEYAKAQGLGEASGEYADNSAHKMTDALFRMMLDPKAHRDPGLIRSELEKYVGKGMVDAGTQRDAQHALGATEANTWVSQTMAKAIRYDYDGNPDPEGHIRWADIVKAEQELKSDDPQREAKLEALERSWTRHFAAYNRAGAELENIVVRKGMADGGRFAVPENDLDWQKFNRLYSDRAKHLRDQTDDRIYRTEQRDIRNIKLTSGKAFGATRFYLDQMTPEEIKEFTPAQVDQLMRDNYHGPGTAAPEDRAHALEFLNKLKTGKMDPIERKFGQIASQALEEAYKGNKTKARAAMNTAHYILDDAYSASVKTGKPMSENDLRARLVSEFTKKDGLFGTGFMGSRSGESYKRVTKQAEPGYYPDPSNPKKRRYWDGKAWK